MGEGFFVSSGPLGCVCVCVCTPEAGAAQKKRKRKKKGMTSNKRFRFPSDKHTQMGADSAPFLSVFLFFFRVCGMNICMRGRRSKRRDRVDVQDMHTLAAAAADAHTHTVVIKT